MPLMKTQDLNTKIITKKPKNARNCESRARFTRHSWCSPDTLHYQEETPNENDFQESQDISAHA
jgi:hypothetical protein